MGETTIYACPECGYDGPHDWFAPNEAECGDCHAEFSRDPADIDAAAWDCGSGRCDPNTGCPECNDDRDIWTRRA